MQEIVSVYVLCDHDIIRTISVVASVPEYAFNIRITYRKIFSIRYLLRKKKKNFFVIYCCNNLIPILLYFIHKTFHSP